MSLAEGFTTMDEFTNFIELVSKMFEAQQAYFRLRTQTNLREAKKLESQVKKEISRLRKVKKSLDAAQKIEQQTLWGKS